MGVSSLLNLVLAAFSIHDPISYNPFDEAVIDVVNRYTERTVHLFYLTSNIPSDNIAASLNVPVILNTSSENLVWLRDTYLVLSHDVFPIINLLRNSSLTFRRDTPWVLGLPNKVKDERLSELFEEFFKRGMLNVAALHLEGLDVQVQTYFPFQRESENGCYNYHPVLIDVWSNTTFSRRDQMFPGNKVDNVQKCFMKSIIFTTAPLILYSRDDTANPLRGAARGLFNALREKMNFTPVFELVTNHSASIEEVKTSPSAVGFGVSGSDLSVAHGASEVKCFTWCLPRLVKRMRGSEALLNTFGSDLWITCIASASFGIVVTHLLGRFSNHESRIITYPSWLIVWNIVFEAPVPLPKSTKFRIFFMSFCIAALVIGTVFKARLHVIMSSPPSVSKISTLSELHKSGFDYIVGLEKLWMLEFAYNNSHCNENRIRCYDRGQVNVADFFVRELKKGNGAILTPTDYCGYIGNLLGNTEEGYHKVYSFPECIASVDGLSLGYSHESPFSYRMKRILTGMWENGMTHKFLDSSLSREVIVPSKNVVITFQDVRVVFVVLLDGLALSFIVFVVEYCLNFNVLIKQRK